MKSTLLIILINLTFISFSQSWQDVGGGTNNSSHGMLTWNGKLVNLGSFNNPCARTALWDGASWSCLPTSQMGQVARAGVVWNGNLVVVGDFWNTQQPCVGCNGVAMWDDVNQIWLPLGDGVNNDVLCCTVYNGDLIIGGDFTEASGVPSSRVVRYNETTDTWESIGAVTDFDNDVRCMTVFEGELWVGGDFNNVGGNSPSDGVVKWKESTQTWVGGNSGVDLVGGVNETVRVLYVNPNDGNLYMGGHFPELIDGDFGITDYNMAGVARYDGSNWYALGTGLNDYCRAIHEYNGNLIVGGYFTTADGVACNKIAKWNGTTFSPMGQGFDGGGIDEYVKSATVWNGIFFAGGAYTQAEGGPMNFIAQWYEAPVVAPVANISASSPSTCAGECIYFDDNSTNSPTTWTWSFPGADVTSSSAETPGDICYSTAGTYTVTLQACNANGCDNTTYDVTIGNTPTLTSNSESICDGETAVLTATPSAGGGTYYWSPGGETTQSINVTPGTTSSYSVTYTLNGCTSSPATSTVTVNPSPTVTVNSETICEGQSITLTATPSVGGGTYTWFPGGETSSSIVVSPAETTAYSVDYLASGCTGIGNSIVTVNPTYSSSESISVCENELYTYPDGTSETIINNTSHTSNLLTTSGCDSIIITNITVGTTYSLTENIDVCQGTTYTYPDGTSEVINSNTSHTSALTTTFGCDSTINTNVTMVTAYNITESASVCANSSYTYPDGSSETITINTSHTSNLSSVNGCDSIVVTNVTALPIYSISQNASVCVNNLFTYPDGTTETITSSTSHTSNLNSVAGCDSVIITNVTALPVYNTSTDVNICQNATITYPDGSSEVITSNTSHTSMLSSIDGCDSIVVTNVTMQSPSVITESIDVCTGSNYTYPDGTTSTNITVNESHVSSLQSVYGCDSTVTTNLTVVSSFNTSESVEVCSGNNYTYPDGTISSNITSDENHVSTLSSQAGCDSIVTTYITVPPMATLDPITDQTICYGASVTLNAVPSITGGSFEWTPGMESTSSITVSPTNTTTYIVGYTLNNCSYSEESVTITVESMIDNGTSETANVITANQNGASYQWLDCGADYSPIVNETNQSYSPVSNGSYAVEVTINGCSDTSACVDITTIGINELDANGLYVYPSPTSEQLNIHGQVENFIIYNALGQKVIVGKNNTVNVKMLPDGIYIISINNGVVISRFVKKS